MHLDQTKINYNPFSIGLCIIFLMVVALFTFDIYYPSLPDIASCFGTTPSKIQLSVTFYFFPLAFSQLFYGPFSNHYGRKKMLILGTFFAFCGSILCYFSQTTSLFISGRFIQGLGVGAYYGLTRAIMRDLFTGEKMARFNSLISAAISLSPCLAPILGGYLHTFFGWRSNFILLSLLFALAFLIIFLFLPETKGKNLDSIKVTKDYFLLIKNKNFMKYLTCSALAYSGLVIFLTLAPFIFERDLLFTPIQFSWISLWVMIGLTIGALLNSQLVMKFEMNKLIKYSGILMLLSGFFLLSLRSCITEHFIAIILPSILFTASCNVIFANAAAGALTPLSTSIGTGSALFGCIQIIGPALSSAFITILPYSYLQILEFSYIFIGTTILWLLSRISSKPSQSL